MNVLILDDDKRFAEKIHHDLFNRFSGICDRTSFDIITEHFENINFQSKYDIAFIDIDLNHQNGIEIAKYIRQAGICTIIVFVTAHAHLVYNSLTARPFFFLRKDNYQNDLEVLFDLIDDSFDDGYLLPIKFHGSNEVVAINEIIYVECVAHSLIIHTINKTYTDSRLLKTFLEDTASYDFVQIHKSFAINLNYLLSYTANEVTLAGNNILNIGRAYKTNFLELYQAYLIK